MNSKLGDKRKRSEESKKSHKIRKDDKTYGASGLTDDDYNLIVDQMVELANETHQKIDERNTDLVRGITYLLQTLYVLVKEFRAMVSRDPF